MGTKAQMSIFDVCLGKKLVKDGQGFLANFAETRRLSGGGDEVPQESLKSKPVPRRSRRLNPVPDQKEIDEQTEAKIRKRRRKASIFVPKVHVPEDIEEEDVQEKRKSRGRAQNFVQSSEPNQQEEAEDKLAAKMRRSRRRAGLFVPPEPEEPYTVKKQKKTVRFVKVVQSKLYSMVEASPRKVGRWYRPRVEMGEPLEAAEPMEARRLKRPRAHLRQLPTLTTRQIKTILGSTTQVLSAERQMELIRDSGCMSTCGEKGCGASCLCMINGIPCDDRHCPCIEETCPNARDDLVVEEPEAFRRRVEIANFELAEMSYGADQSTISSIEDTTINEMYSSGAEDVADAVDIDRRTHSQPDSQNNSTTTGSENVMYASVSIDIEEVPEEIPEEVERHIGMKSSEEAPEDAADFVDFDNDREADDAAGEEEKDNEDEMEADNSSESSDNHTDDDEDDFGVDLTVEHYPPTILRQLPDAVDAEARDSCVGRQWLDSSAVFVGLLKEATRHNHKDASSGSRCAVLHPEVFSSAMRLATRDEAEKNRRKAARIRGAAPPLALDPQDIAQLVVFGNEWDHMLIPMHISGIHWAVTVVTRASVSAVIFDSLKKLAERPKEETEKIKAAIKKILEATQALNNTDKTTGRYKVRLTKKGYRLVQQDTYNCGIFAIVQARRALERGNSNVSTRKNTDDREPNTRAERQALRSTICGLMGFFEDLADQNQPLAHGPGGFLECIPRKLTLGRTSPRR